MPISDTFIEHIKPFQRIVILGTSGSGKTTLSNALGLALHLPVIELDKFQHGPNWTPSPPDEFREKVSNALSNQNRWIIDGNYGIARDLIWPRAEAAIWLNYSFGRVFRQLLGRTVRRSLKQEVLWNGNTESLSRAFLSKESILLWAIKSYPENKKRYPLLFLQPEYSHLKVIEIRHPKKLQTKASKAS